MSSSSSPSGSRRGIRSSLGRLYDKTRNLLEPSPGSESGSRISFQGASAPSTSPQSLPHAESTPKTNSNLHLPASYHTITHQASASSPDLARDTIASPTPAIGRASRNNTTPEIETNQPDHDDGKKNRGRSWMKLDAALQILYQSAPNLPPLQSAIGTFRSCLEVIQVTIENRQDYDDLASGLGTLITALQEHLSKSSSKSMSDCVANVLRSLEEEVEYMSSKKERGIISAVGRASEDEEEILRCYRRIETLFRLLQFDASLSIWDIAQEHLVNTRLEGMTPAKAANYNSAVPANVARGECTENTRTDVLAGMNEWSNDPNAAKVYWLNGMAGTGKTTIACSLSVALAKRKQLGASFFCTRVLDECRDAIRIIPTIAYQLARYSRPFQQALFKVLENDPDIAKKIIPTQFERLLKDPLLEIRDAIPSNVVVVIDALDECHDNGSVRILLDTLFHHAADLPLRFFVASRPEPEIIEKMQSQGEDVRSIFHLHEIEQSSVQADIARYLWRELAFMSPTKEEIDRLVQLSDNLFIFAATTARYIKLKRRPAVARGRLQTILTLKSESHTMYAELDKLYTTILEDALNDSRIDEEDVDQFQLVLWTAVCVREPIPIETLAALAGLDEENIEETLQSLRSVLHIAESSGLVSTLHASFPDFIFTQRRSQKFFCEESSHAAFLARQCFKVMQDELRFNICRLESSFVLDEEVEDLEKRVDKYISRKLSYACQFWGDHLSLAVPASNLCSLLELFLSNRLLFWLEVLNLRKSSTLGKFILQNIRSWLTSFNDPALPDIVRLTSDSLDFATVLSVNPVMHSTPHIYISLLPFCHKSSLVFRHYWGRVQGLLHVGGTAMEHPASTAVANYNVGTPIWSIAVSPDGSVIAFGGGEWNPLPGGPGMIGLIRQHDGNFVVRPFEGHAGLTKSIAFSPDGTRIVSGSLDSTICVWNSNDGTLAVGPFQGHTRGVTSVAFSPDGTRIVSGSADEMICVWDALGGTLAVGPLTGHTHSIESVAFSPDGARIVSGSQDEIQVWNAQNGERLYDPIQAPSYVTSVTFTPSGMHIISGSLNGTICVWNAADGNITVGPFTGHVDAVWSVACSPDGTCIASGSNDRTICVWNVHDGKLLSGPLRGHTILIIAVAFSLDSTRIISGSWDGTIHMWKAQGSKPVTSMFGENTGRVLSAAFSLDGTQVVFGSFEGTISVWNVQDGELVASPFKGHTDWINSVAFSPDNTRIVSASRDMTICVWDAKNGTPVAGPITGHTGWIECAAFSPDARRIVSGSCDKTICVWNAQDGQLVAGPFTDPDCSEVNIVAFSPDGARIVAGSLAGTVYVLNAQNGEVLAVPFKRHTDFVCSVAFSPDGSRIVSGSQDRSTCVWNVQDGTLAIDPIKGHTERVTSVSFSPDGVHIVSGSLDGTICLWRIQDGQLVAGPFKGHAAWILSVVFSTDGSHILSVSRDCCIHSTNFQTIAPPTSILQADWDVESSGWVVNPDGQHLLWVPPRIRSFLPRPRTPNVLCPEGTLRVDFADRDLFLGDNWHQCFIEP